MRSETSCVTTARVIGGHGVVLRFRVSVSAEHAGGASVVQCTASGAEAREVVCEARRRAKHASPLAARDLKKRRLALVQPNMVQPKLVQPKLDSCCDSTVPTKQYL